MSFVLEFFTKKKKKTMIFQEDSKLYKAKDI